jgi:hypothetical protein
VVLSSSLARAQEQGYAFRWSNFRIEFAGGWAGTGLGDFNTATQNENLYLDHYFLKRYAAYSPVYRYTAGESFLPLETVTPIGASIRYQVSPTFALSLGVQYLRGERTSDVGLDVEVGNDPAGIPFTAHYRNQGFVQSVKAWMPQLGAHFGWDLLKFLRAEIFLLGGPILGDCRVWSQRRESLTTAEGTVSSGSRTLEITGHSNSVAIELGGQARFKLLPFLEVYGQGGYAFRKLAKIRGPRTIRTVTESPVPSETLYSLTGIWGRTWERADTPWGAYASPILTTEYGTQAWSFDSGMFGTASANVDLSGFQLTAGISIRL